MHGIADEMENDSPDLGGGFTEAPAWQEGKVALPDFPQKDDLIKVEVDRVDMPFSFYLDSKNLTSSTKQGLVKYTVLVESNSGAKNILFEGLRCELEQYKTYAYGTYDNKFVKAKTSEWRFIRDNGHMVHRYNFLRYYMCNEQREPYPASEIIRKIKYPEDFLTTSEESD